MKIRPLPSSTLASILLLGTVLVWGATFVIVKDALVDASPLLFNLIRMTLASLVLAAINWRSLRQITRSQLVRGSFVGVFLAAGYQFQTAGLARTTAAKSAFLTGLVVVFVPLLTVLPRLRPAAAPRPGWSTMLGTLLAFAGLFLLTTPSGTVLSNLAGALGLGDLLSLVCALAFAAHLLTLAHFSPGIPAPLLASVQIAASAVVMAASLPLESHPYVLFTPRLLIALLVTSILATAAAFTIQSYAQQHLPPTQTAILLTLEPVFAALTSVLFLHEHLGSRAMGGACLILGGIVCIEFLAPRPLPAEIPA